MSAPGCRGLLGDYLSYRQLDALGYFHAQGDGLGGRSGRIYRVEHGARFGDDFHAFEEAVVPGQSGRQAPQQTAGHR